MKAYEISQAVAVLSGILEQMKGHNSPYSYTEFQKIEMRLRMCIDMLKREYDAVSLTEGVQLK